MFKLVFFNKIKNSVFMFFYSLIVLFTFSILNFNNYCLS